MGKTSCSWTDSAWFFALLGLSVLIYKMDMIALPALGPAQDTEAQMMGTKLQEASGCLPGLLTVPDPQYCVQLCEGHMSDYTQSLCTALAVTRVPFVC